MKLRLTLGICLCLAAALAFPGPAPAAVRRIDAVFLAEYSDPAFTIDQGDVVTFLNRDPFLAHGVESDAHPGGDPLFEAPVVDPKGTRLVRGAPFLTTGSYPFHSQVDPDMTATLVVTANGAPLPADTTAPSAGIKVKTGTLKALLKRRRLRFTVSPVEISDATFTARAAGVVLATAERTYLTVKRRALTLRISRTAAADLRARVAELKRRHRRATKLKVSAALADVAGNEATSTGAHPIKLPAPAPAPTPPRRSK